MMVIAEFYNLLSFENFQVPLLRWKRFAVLAAMCILSVRAVIVQLAFFLHMQVLYNSLLCFLEASSSR